VTAPDLTAVRDGWEAHADRVAGRGHRRRALWGWARGVRSRLTGPARMLPGLAAAGCAFAGAWLTWSLGVALLVAAGLLLLVDARTPQG
jgi:hypothetical protein